MNQFAGASEVERPAGSRSFDNYLKRQNASAACDQYNTTNTTTNLYYDGGWVIENITGKLPLPPTPTSSRRTSASPNSLPPPPPRAHCVLTFADREARLYKGRWGHGDPGTVKGLAGRPADRPTALTALPLNTPTSQHACLPVLFVP